VPTSQNKGNYHHLLIEMFIANWQHITYCITETVIMTQWHVWIKAVNPEKAPSLYRSYKTAKAAMNKARYFSGLYGEGNVWVDTDTGRYWP
jgi:hypothetical protein